MLIDLVIKYHPSHSVSTNLIDHAPTPMLINLVENSNDRSNDITRNLTLNTELQKVQLQTREKTGSRKHGKVWTINMGRVTKPQSPIQS